jgi:dihydrofolate reductase
MAMAKLTMTSFVTLDGVMQGPGGPQEDTSGGFTQGGWVVPYVDGKFGEFIVGIFSRASAFLLGRGTWQIFAGWWPKVTDPKDPVAAALNGLPKYVATHLPDRLDLLSWRGSSALRDVVSDVKQLKGKLTGELQVHGSPGLGQTLLREGLLDELNLLVFPVALGAGKRLFGDGVVPTAFELVQSHPSSTGVLLCTFRRKGTPTYGTVGG